MIDPATHPDYRQAAKYVDVAGEMLDMVLAMSFPDDPYADDVRRFATAAIDEINKTYRCCIAAEMRQNQERPL